MIRAMTEDAKPDLNYFFQREQVERVRADLARSREARRAHLDLADLYRGRIHSYRDSAASAPLRA